MWPHRAFRNAVRRVSTNWLPCAALAQLIADMRRCRCELPAQSALWQFASAQGANGNSQCERVTQCEPLTHASGLAESRGLARSSRLGSTKQSCFGVRHWHAFDSDRAAESLSLLPEGIMKKGRVLVMRTRPFRCCVARYKLLRATSSSRPLPD